MENVLCADGINNQPEKLISEYNVVGTEVDIDEQYDNDDIQMLPYHSIKSRTSLFQVNFKTGQ